MSNKVSYKDGVFEPLEKYVFYYHGSRTHLSLAKNAPTSRRVQAPVDDTHRDAPRVSSSTFWRGISIDLSVASAA
jgi:hypothetical protein